MLGSGGGELGVFEAASLVSSRLAGATIPVARAARVLFRGLGSGLPIVPGLVFRREAREAKAT